MYSRKGAIAKLCILQNKEFEKGIMYLQQKLLNFFLDVCNLNFYLFFLRVSFLKTNYVISKIENYV
jgi:hypothetical protein